MYINEYASGNYDFSTNLKCRALIDLGRESSGYEGGGYNFTKMKPQALIDLGRKSKGYEGGGYTFANNLRYMALIDLMRKK